LLAIMVVFIRKGLLHGLENPSEIENKFGIPVYASVLHSNLQVKLARQLKRTKSDKLPILAIEAGDDLVIEALRSLRTSLQFALLESRNNIITFGGPAPGIGKSFISVNFAHVLADVGKKVILVDADMRKGHLHDYFDQKRDGGLSEILSGKLSLKDAIYKTDHENLSFISSGIVPPNPSELLTSNNFTKLIEDLDKKYDFIVIDTPPILAVTDAIIVSRIAGIFFMILQSKKHHFGEIEHTLKRMENNGVRPQGIILNNVNSTSTKYGSGGYRYVYQYKYK
jgi:tyrosine-protein kinase Etk/Wzc